MLTAKRFLFKYDGQGFVGILDLLTSKYTYSLRPDIIRKDLFKTEDSFLLHGLPRKDLKIAKNSCELNLFQSIWNHYKTHDSSFDISLMAADKKKYNRARFKKRDVAKAFLNGAVYKSLETADKESLTIARRFCPESRFEIYECCVKNERMKQLFQIDPVFAFVVLSGNYTKISPKKDILKSKKTISDSIAKDIIPNIEEIWTMIQDGEKLNKIYKAAKWPSASKNIKPGIFAHKKNFFIDYLKIIKDLDNGLINNLLPKTTLKQLRWFGVAITVGSLRHYSVFTAPGEDEAKINQKDILYWLGKTSENFVNLKVFDAEDSLQSLFDYIRTTNLYGVRQFNKNMSFKTVSRNSELWHHRQNEHARLEEQRRLAELKVASEIRRLEIEEQERQRVAGLKNEKLPAWPLEDWKYNEWSIKHIDNGFDLYEEGFKLCHCIESHKDDILMGNAVVFSLQFKNKRKNTIELINNNGVFVFDQARGYHNSSPTADEKRITRKWLEYVKKHFTAQMEQNKS